MLKSWKTRAMATAGAVALAAPFAFMGGATAQTAGTAVVTSVNSSSGNFTPGSTVNVNGTGCTPTATTTQTATLRLRGPGGTTAAPVVSSTTATVLNDGSFQGSVIIPTDARTGDQFLVTAICSSQGTQGVESTMGGGANNPFTVSQGSILSGSVTGGLLSTTGTTGGTTTLSGVLSGQLSGGTSTSTGGFGTSGGTTGVAQPITATPRFTG